MTGRQRLAVAAVIALLFTAELAGSQDEGEFAFAVVSKVSKDRRQVMAHVYAGGSVRETALIPTDAIHDNLIWKKLEICHSLKMTGSLTTEGYRIGTLKNLDAGMLPMGLQGVAGDCLTKKALEFAPAID